MGIVAAYAVPHPPLIVPAVGRGEEAAIARTVEAYQEVARRIAAHAPDTVVVVSPHAPAYRDGFFMSDAPSEAGSLAAFGQPQEALATQTDVAFAHELAHLMGQHGLPAAGAPAGAAEIDHATFVPLHFLGQAIDLDGMRFVRVGLSGLPSEDHRLLGRLIARAADELGRRCVVVASGDLSHRLKPDGPYGFDSAGPAFDEAVCAIFENGNLDGLFGLDPRLCDDAAECGLRSFQIMAGALEGGAFAAELLGYEGPFGVGYAVAAFEADVAPASSQEEAACEEPRDGCDPLVALARETVEAYVREGRTPEIPRDMPEEWLRRRAGVFVSLHEHGELRGCIGTIEPQRRSVADEVVANAVSAATSDPRFPAVAATELDSLEYSVDVLGEPEPVDDLVELDPKRYGVIATHGWRRGLLLPDLEGVDTVMDQIAIAKHKAGIAPGEDAKLERFEVVRHTAGGAARKDSRGQQVR